MDNRRKTKRTHTSISGSILARGKKRSIHIRNLSEGGLLILMDRPLMDGFEIEIEFEMKSAKTVQIFKSMATVTWCSEDMDAGYQCGVQFNNMSPKSKKLLRSFLNSISS